MIVSSTLLLAISIAMTIASFAYSMLTKPKFNLPDSKKGVELNEMTTEAYLSVVYGTEVVGAKIFFYEADPSTTEYLCIGAALAVGECERVEEIYFNKELALKWDGTAHEWYQSGHFISTEKFKTKKGAHTILNAEAFTGHADQTVSPLLQSIFGTTRYENERAGKHICYITLRLMYDMDVYPYGMPDITAKVIGRKVKDVRSESYPDVTAAWSDNPVLCLADYLTSNIYGLNAVASELNLSQLGTEANFCDDDVSIPINLPGACKAELYSDVTPDTYGPFKLDDHPEWGDNTGWRVTLPHNATTITRVYYQLSGIDLEENVNYSHEDGSNTVYLFYGMVSTDLNILTDYEYRSPSLSLGDYRYKVTYKTAAGETTAGPNSAILTTKSGYQAAKLYSLPVSASENVTGRGIYRTVAGGSVYKLVAYINNNTDTEYIDTVPDASLGADEPATDTSGGGTQKRFTCNGAADTSQTIKTNLENLATSARLNIYYSSGQYGAYIRKVTTPEPFELNEDNIIGDWRWSMPGAKDMVNVIKASYRNPDANNELDVRYWPKKDNVNQFLIDDNNFENIKEIRLDFTNNRNRVDQIAMVIRAESRQMITASCTAKEGALSLLPGSLVNITHSTPGWVQKPFWVEHLEIAQNGTKRVALKEYDATSYDYANIDKDPVGAPDTTLTNALVPQSIGNVAFTAELFRDGNIKRTRVNVTYDTPASCFWSHADVWISCGGADYTWYCRIDRNSGGKLTIDPPNPTVTLHVKFLSATTWDNQEILEDVHDWTYDIADVLPPGDVENFAGEVLQLPAQHYMAVLRWDAPEDGAEYEIREGVSWVTAHILGRTSSLNYTIVALTAGAHTYRIKAFDEAGNESDNDASVTITSPQVTAFSDVTTINFSSGTFDQTEQHTDGTYGTVLRLKQNYITNSSFETNTTGWTAPTGWVRTSDKAYSGTWSLRTPLGTHGVGDYAYMQGGDIAISNGKHYSARAWVWANAPNLAYLGLRLDSVADEKYTVHPGDGKWHELVVNQKVSTAHAQPQVRLWKDAAGKAYYDLIRFAPRKGTYTSAEIDRGAVYTERLRLQYTAIGELHNKAGITVYLGWKGADPGSSYVWLPMLQASEAVITARYLKVKAELDTKLIGDTLYLQPVTIQKAAYVPPAESGSNVSITSLGGLTTPLSVSQGGTGASDPANGRAALGAAESGANSSITSLTGLTTALSVSQGGTGATSAANARANLSAAQLGYSRATTITSNTTLDDTYDVIDVDASGGSITITLPTISGSRGKWFRLRRISATDPAKTITIVTTGGEKIDGYDNGTLNAAQYQTVNLEAGASGWLIF